MSDRWRDYQVFRHELMEESKRALLSPGQVAMYLEARRKEFPDYILDWEIRAYRRSPEDWKGVVLP